MKCIDPLQPVDSMAQNNTKPMHLHDSHAKNNRPGTDDNTTVPQTASILAPTRGTCLDYSNLPPPTAYAKSILGRAAFGMPLS